MSVNSVEKLYFSNEYDVIHCLASAQILRVKQICVLPLCSIYRSFHFYPTSFSSTYLLSGYRQIGDIYEISIAI